MDSFLEQAFGKQDVTTPKMRAAQREWLDLYFGAARPGEDPSARLPVVLVGKLCRTVFAEYESRLADPDPWLKDALTALDGQRACAMQYAMAGGECLLKPVLGPQGIGFVPLRRDCYVPLARDNDGTLREVGSMELFTDGGRRYALLEHRAAGPEELTIRTRLFEVYGQTLGRELPLNTLPACGNLVPELVLPGVPGVGLAALRMPLVNCVDGSSEAVSLYAPAVGLIRALGRCDAQLEAEFRNGASRVFASEDLLRPDASGSRALRDDLFVGLPDDPANVGVTVYSPALREQSYLNRRQDLLRSVENLLGLKRGLLSEAADTERTAAEIAATGADYDLTVRELQRVWEDAARQAMTLCAALGRLYGRYNGGFVPGALSIDWGDGVLYDRARLWEEQRQMVADGLLRPELALAWYYGLPHETEKELAAVRQRLMPQHKS